MAYRQTRQESVEFFDGKNATIGGFFGATADQTAIKIVTPNGTTRYIVCDDAGVLSTVTTLP